MSKEETLFDLCGQVNQGRDHAEYYAGKLREEMDALVPIRNRVARELKALGKPVLHHHDVFWVDGNGKLGITNAVYSYDCKLDPALKDEPPVKEPCKKCLNAEPEQADDEDQISNGIADDIVELYLIGRTLIDTFRRGMKMKSQPGSLSFTGLLINALHDLLEDEDDEEDDEPAPVRRQPITPTRIGPDAILPAEAATDDEDDDEQEERLHVAIVDNEVS